MPMRLLTQPRGLPPRSLFGLLLAIVFFTEAVVMIVLPMLVQDGKWRVLEIFVDAFLLTLLLAPLLWKLVIRPLQQLAEDRLLLLARLLSAQEDERRRVAHDLHDELGQYLTTLNIGLRTLEETHSLEEIQTRARELRGIGAAAHEEIRRLVHGLRPAVLDDVGLTAALERLTAEMRDTNAVEISLSFIGMNDNRLPATIETALYRIVQEATANAVRHGKAKQIQIDVTRRAEEVELCIVDRGCGFDVTRVSKRPAADGPIGLFGIRQRTEELRGEVTIESAIGIGTKIRVRIPLRGYS
jgi:signal transduction histidine kinase